MKGFLNKIIIIEEKIKQKFFVEKIENKKMIFERKMKRNMGQDEINQYKFSLFTFYSILLIIPIILLISFIKG